MGDLKYINRICRTLPGQPCNLAYLTFFPAMEIGGFPASEFAVAETLGFSCFGFLASLFPRLLLLLAMVFPSKIAVIRCRDGRVMTAVIH
ncbi:hypothetical protein [Roseovarius aestuarii]|uniref:hypothetical protein n=1 Tax=Roseovarius aestuarii TaxID=475083 RepID=UPI003671030A